MSTASGNQRVGGFSLIELMVVVGIIGVLASLLLSALSNARAKGLQTQCANNLRQLGIAQEQFVSEHHGYPFVGENSNPPNGFPKEGWADALGPYAGGYRLNTDRKPWQGFSTARRQPHRPAPHFPRELAILITAIMRLGSAGFLTLTARWASVRGWARSQINQCISLYRRSRQTSPSVSLRSPARLI